LAQATSAQVLGPSNPYRDRAETSKPSCFDRAMATLQEVLFQRKLDREMPERVAELALQAAKKKHKEDMADIQTIEAWHASEVHGRILEWHKHTLESQSSPQFEGEVLFCGPETTASGAERQKVANIVEGKGPLVTQWYAEKHGLSVVFKANRRGTGTTKAAKYLSFSFWSADVEAKMRAQCLAQRSVFETDVRLALVVLQKKMLDRQLIEKVRQFVPSYADHLKEEKDKVEKARLW